MQQIISIGCEAEPQVGVAGYLIDIGVKHAQWPHGYIMVGQLDAARATELHQELLVVGLPV